MPVRKAAVCAGTVAPSRAPANFAEVADLEIKRKSGGLPIDVGLETFLLSRLR